MVEKPRVTAQGLKELDKVAEQLDSNVEKMASGDLPAKNIETEQQTKISTREAQTCDAPYLKPERNFDCKAKFNEKYRAAWEHDRQYVRAIAENYEIVGESIAVWTKPYAGVPYEFWKVPVNKPIMIPRHLANQLASRKYIRYVMSENKVTSQDGYGTYTGAMEQKEYRSRLDARPISSNVTVAF